MPMRKHRLLVPGVIGGVLVLLLGMLLFPQTRAYWHLNQAQLQRLHGQPSPAHFAAAVALAPNNPHIRWQAATATTDCTETNALLLPLADHPRLSPLAVELLLTCLLATNQPEQAALIYLQHAGQLTPTPDIAIPLLHALATTTAPPASIDAPALLPLLAALSRLDHTNAVHRTWLISLLAEPATFWTSALGQTLAQSLAWRTTAPVATPVAPADPPDLRHLAQLLGVEPAALTLGPALLDNGRIGGTPPNTGTPPHWGQSYWNYGNNHNLGLFLLGVDVAPELPRQPALRIDLLARNEDPQQARTRAGFWYSTPITLTAQAPYVLSFWYRTQGLPDNAAALFLTEAHDVLFRNDLRLPASEGQWQQVTIIGWNQTDQAQTVRPLLRLWEPGSVWFTNVSLHALQSSPPLPPQPTIIHIAPVP